LFLLEISFIKYYFLTTLAHLDSIGKHVIPIHVLLLFIHTYVFFFASTSKDAFTILLIAKTESETDKKKKKKKKKVHGGDIYSPPHTVRPDQDPCPPGLRMHVNNRGSGRSNTANGRPQYRTALAHVFPKAQI